MDGKWYRWLGGWKSWKGYMRSNSHDHHTCGFDPLRWYSLEFLFGSQEIVKWIGSIILKNAYCHISLEGLEHAYPYLPQILVLPATPLQLMKIAFVSLSSCKWRRYHRIILGPCFLVVFLENLGGWESRTSPARKPFMSINAHWLQFPPKSSSNFLIQNTTS